MTLKQFDFTNRAALELELRQQTRKQARARALLMSTGFCCLFDALQGRKHTDKVRAVQKIRTTITIKDSGAGGGSGGSGQQQPQPPQSRRIQLGLIPTLNLPCFWKAVLQAVRITQAQHEPDAHATCKRKKNNLNSCVTLRVKRWVVKSWSATAFARAYACA